MARVPAIDQLLNLVPDSPDRVLSALRDHPELASRQDSHGYSLVHAAVSYEQLDLVKALIQEFRVDPNIKDEDGETCLFNAESVTIAQELVALGTRFDEKNSEGQTAAEKLADEDEQPEVAEYLRQLSSDVYQSNHTQPDASVNDPSRSAEQANGHLGSTEPPPPLPAGIHVNIGTMQADALGEEPDPNFRRRIEELASRPDFQSEEGQRELRGLISDAISGISGEGQGPTSRRRLE